MKRNVRFTTDMGEAARLASLVVSLLWLLTSGALASDTDTKQVTFEGAKSEHKWTLKDLNPELPSDWSTYNWLWNSKYLRLSGFFCGSTTTMVGGDW